MKRLVPLAALVVAFSLPAAAHEGHDHAAPQAKAAEPARARTAWGASYFPNVPLVTQDGKVVHLYDDLLKGKKVMIDFVFAQCDKGCPLDTANMARVQKLLGSRVGADIFMYSITLDPENDTPQVLKEYAAQFDAGPGWLFLTGKREDIDAVRYKFGQRDAKESHANTVQVGDVDKGRWIRVPLTADPNYIALETTNALYPGWSNGKTLKSIAQAERMELFGPGQILFYNRCAACHGFGKGEGIGPDLKNVTNRRSHDWLARFLAAPDRMRAEKDPTALELAQGRKVLMPNLSLTTKETREILEYMAAQDAPRPTSTPAEPSRPLAGHAAHHQH
jgi:protein SCO1/2